jgi:hypothetical protein
MKRNELVMNQYYTYTRLKEQVEVLDRMLPPNLMAVWQVHYNYFRIDICEPQLVNKIVYPKLILSIGQSGASVVEIQGFMGDVSEVMEIVNQWLSEEQQ